MSLWIILLYVLGGLLVALFLTRPWKSWKKGFVLISQILNWFNGPWLNVLLVRHIKAERLSPYQVSKFGFPDETLSSVFEKNRKLIPWCGTAAGILDFIDRGHGSGAVELDEGKSFNRRDLS